MTQNDTQNAMQDAIEDGASAPSLIPGEAATVRSPIDLAMIYAGGFSILADQVQNPTPIALRALPGLDSVDAEARIVVGDLGTARVAVMGPVARHGDPAASRLQRAALEWLAQAGAKAVVFAGAAGSVQEDLKPGALVMVRDHINLTGLNALAGQTPDLQGVDLSEAYDPILRERLRVAAAEFGRKTHEGVYMWFPGPSFETPAEIRAARILGADLVGMSIVPETVIARRLGLRVLALTLITNHAAGLSETRLGGDNVRRVTQAGIAPMVRTLVNFCQLWRLDSHVAEAHGHARAAPALPPKDMSFQDFTAKPRAVRG